MAIQTPVINHLEYDYTEPVRDPLWKHIYLSPGLLKVIEQEPFLTLGNIKQLGAAYLVYPGATHNRLNHSLGVFHLAKRIIRALSGSPYCTRLSVEGVKAFLSAALLHDVGHFPFTHSFKELPLREHENITAEIVQTDPIARVLREKVGTDPRMVAAIVDGSIDPKSDTETIFYRNILSGALDPDKLDYLNRDAYFCGVSYGTQDIDFVINRIIPNDEKGIALESGGLAAVENILFSKYLMYRTVYWHKTVRIATAMIKKAVFLGLREGIIAENDLYGLDDNKFFSFFAAGDFKPFRLIDTVLRRNLLKTMIDCPFDPENKDHLKLLDLSYRNDLENAIASEIKAEGCSGTSQYSVIIDIPEPISFEINIPILAGERLLPFPESGTVFSKAVVQGFTRVLRRVRLVVPEECLGREKSCRQMFPWE